MIENWGLDLRNRYDGRIRTLLQGSGEEDTTKKMEEGFGVTSTDAGGLAQKKYDMIVDDGLHEPLYQAKTMQNMWPLLRPGGRYFVEDIPEKSLLDLKKQIASLALPGMINMEVVDYQEFCIQRWCQGDTRILYVEKSADVEQQRSSTSAAALAAAFLSTEQ